MRKKVSYTYKVLLYVTTNKMAGEHVTLLERELDEFDNLEDALYCISTDIKRDSCVNMFEDYDYKKLEKAFKNESNVQITTKNMLHLSHIYEDCVWYNYSILRVENY